MWSMTVLLAAWLSLSSGNTIPRHKGCFSTTFVQQYASYYRLSHLLSIQECIAACNNRLTRFMGLAVHDSYPFYNYVFCGNDLVEVSPKIHDGQCIPCQDNTTYSCGRNGTMSVYLLRDSTPFSLLLATDRGVEMLSDNVTTLRVAHNSNSEYKSLDYIYDKDIIFSAIGTSFFRFVYNPMTMKFSQHLIVGPYAHPSPSLAVDFLQMFFYYGYKGDNALYRECINCEYTSVLSGRRYSYPDKISIDPYNKSLVFLEIPTNTINVLTWDSHFYSLSLDHLHVHLINALSMDIHEKLLYAILTFKDDSSAYLVSLDYGVSQMRVVFRGPQLVNATALEVFQGDAVWLRNISGVSTIFRCKLTPRCQEESITAHQSNQKIYDFSIYHPEKQTPGKQRLCADLTCSHGCQLFSPFTARCSCPTGMEVDLDNSTCVLKNHSTQTFPTASIAPTHESSIKPDDSTTVMVVSTFLPEVKVCSPNENTEYRSLFYETLAILGISNLIMLVSLIFLSVLVFKFHKKNNDVAQILRQRVELNSVENDLLECALLG